MVERISEGWREHSGILSPAMRDLMNNGGYSAVDSMILEGWKMLDVADNLPGGITPVHPTRRSLYRWLNFQESGFGWTISESMSNAAMEANTVALQVNLLPVASEGNGISVVALNGVKEIGFVRPGSDRTVIVASEPQFSYPRLALANLFQKTPQRGEICQAIVKSWQNKYQPK